MKMQITYLLWATGSVALIACGGSELDATEAEESAVVPCLFQADATLNMTGSFGSVASNGVAHTNDCQTSFVVDVNAGYLDPLNFTLDGGFDPAATVLTQANCASASNQLVIHKRRVNYLAGTATDWTLLTSRYSASGEWVEDPDTTPFCQLTSPYTVVGSNVPFGAYDQYRVFARPKLAGQYRQALVSWH